MLNVRLAGGHLYGKQLFTWLSLVVSFRVVLGRAYCGLTGGFLLLRNFSLTISVSPHVCFILA